MSTYHSLFEDFDASDPDLIDKRIAYCAEEEYDEDADSAWFASEWPVDLDVDDDDAYEAARSAFIEKFNAK